MIDEEGARLFREAGVDGAFILADLTDNIETVINPSLVDQGFLPASTFKIPNTLIGLETGVIPDERFALKWDGVKRDVEDWNRDHDLASAIKFSVVWFYQEIARRIGPTRMQRSVNDFDYGNRSIDGGIDRFWLDGGLRISPRQQVDFLRRLNSGELPVKAEHAALVRRLLFLEQHGEVVLRGKTGLTVQGDRSVGWLVGFVEQPKKTFAYATLVLARRGEMERMIPLRKSLARKLLQRAGVLPVEDGSSG